MRAEREGGRAALRALVGLLSLAWLLAGCGPPKEKGPEPEDIVRDYLAALERGDADAAYDLLDPSLRGDRDRETFRVYVEANREELLEQAREAVALVNRRAGDLRAVVEVEGTDVEVVRESDGAWRLARPVWPQPRTTTPADTLRALAGALHRGDLGLIHDALLDDRARERLDGLALALRAAADEPIPSDGDPFVVELPGGGSVTLVPVGGEWRVRTLVFPSPRDPATPDAP